MEKYIEIFNKLWEHSENEVVEFKKAETNVGQILLRS